MSPNPQVVMTDVEKSAAPRKNDSSQTRTPTSVRVSALTYESNEHQLVYEVLIAANEYAMKGRRQHTCHKRVNACK